MLSRHEEKYILTYAQYAVLRQRATLALLPDTHGDRGCYTITSLYYDDPQDTGLYEKLDGLALHSKFRVRTYDCNEGFIKLERKDKRGILTKKISAPIEKAQLDILTQPGAWEQFDGTARELVQQLQAKGLLQTPGGKGCKRALVTGARPGQIPVVGVVTAGYPILAVENQEGTMPWHESGCFALRVRGDSMINAGILDGDKVVVRPQATANNGQIVVARIEDEATVKRLWRKNGEIWLMPENENYDPIDGTHAEIIGIVRGVVREY